MNISSPNEHWEDNGQSVPLSDHVLLVGKCERLEQEREALNTEVLQLREVVKKLDAGIVKASETLQEGIARLKDRQMITNLVFELLKKHPESIVIRYRGEDIIAINGEGTIQQQQQQQQQRQQT